MTYMTSIVVFLSLLTFAVAFSAVSIVEDFYDSRLGSDKQNVITVGIQTTITDWTLDHEGAFFLKLNEINNQTEILPNHHIKPIMKDDRRDPQVAFFVGLELNGIIMNQSSEGEHVDFLFGGGYSTTTISSASVSQSFNTPQMSCMATSSVLSNIDVYGTFSRTIPSDEAQSCAWAAIAKFFNWTKIGLISSKTEYGHGLSHGFSECVEHFNVAITVELTFESNVTDHSAKLLTLEKRDVFIYFVAMHYEDMLSLAKSLRGMNLTGDPYVYITGDAVSEKVGAVSEKDKDSDLKKILPGIIYTTPFKLINDSNELVSLKTRYEVAKEK